MLSGCSIYVLEEVGILRFSLRTLILLTLFAALSLAASGYWYRSFHSRSSAVQRLNVIKSLSVRKNGIQLAANEVSQTPFTFDLHNRSFSKAIGRDLALIKDFERISLYQSNVADDDLSCLLSMRGIVHLSLGSSRITSRGMDYVAKLDSLQYLDISKTSVGSEGLDVLARLTNLKSLNCSQTLVDSDGLKNFSRLTKLEYLGLDDTDIDDAAVIHLRGLVALKRLEVSRTGITCAGAQRLANQLPGCRVYRAEGTTQFFYQADPPIN